MPIHPRNLSNGVADETWIFNKDQVDQDFNVRGKLSADASGDLLYVDAANGRIGVGTSAPSGLFHVDGQIRCTSLLVDSGTTEWGDDALLTLGADNDQVLVNRSTALTANTALTGVLDGTPVTPALAANSLIISNTTASGDILIAADRGGNSENYIWVDSSAGDLSLYAPNGEIILTPTTDVQIADGTGLTVGHTAQVTVSNGDGATDLIPEVQVLGSAQADASVLIGCFNATDATPPSLNFLKSGHATVGSNTTVASGERLGDINWFGADGTDFESPAAAIRAEADSTIGTGDMPGRLVFLTTADGGETLTEAIRLTSSQDLRVNNGGGLIVGSTSAQITISDGDGATDLIPEVQILGTAKADGSLLLMVNSATATSAAAPSVNLVKSAHATLGSNTVVASGEVLGEVNFFGADGTDFESCAVSIRGVVNATPGTGDMPGRLSIFTSTDGAETPIERARITGTATAATLALGNAGATTGILTMAGTTSGVVSLTVGAAAGTWTMQLPAAVGSAGQQLTDAAGDGICTWAAASLGEWKHDLGILDPREALKAVLKAPTHWFKYNKEVMPPGQWAPDDVMTGIFAEEAPWAMHGERKGLKSGIAFSPVNAFGYLRAAFEGLYDEVVSLRDQVRVLSGGAA